MRIFKRVLLFFLLFVALLLGIGFFLPREVNVTRSISIDAPAEVVFGLVNDLHEYEKWMPWGKERDPTLVLEHGGAAAGEGAWFKWESASLGSGNRLEIVKSVPPTSVEMALSLGKDNAPADVAFTLAPNAANTTTDVTWSLDGDVGEYPWARYLGLVMDRIHGRDFEQGLAKLKDVAEQEAGARK